MEPLVTPTQVFVSSSSNPTPKHKNEPASSEDNAIKGTPRKTIQAIFSGSLKITYKDLVTTVSALNGNTDEKTGSSSRKMHLPHTTLFMHKRHKRDRAKYVDPKVIKQMKDVLSALGINPDNPRLIISSESKIAQVKHKKVKNRRKK